MKKKSCLVGILLVLSGTACHHPPPEASSMTLDAGQVFAQLGDDFLQAWLQADPVSATQLGDHSQDGRWPDVSLEAEREQLAWLRAVQAELALVPLEQLDAEQRVDAAILAHELEAELFSVQQLRPWEQNPLSAVYTVGSGLDGLVSRDFAPIEQRAASLTARLEALPAFLEQARSRLDAPPELHTLTAIDQTAALVSWVDGPLRERVPAEQRALVEPAADRAEQALREFHSFLQSDLLPRSTGELRLGEERWERKLRFSLDTDLPAAEVQRRAWSLLEQTTREMAEQARLLAPELFPGEPLPPEEDSEAAVELVRRVLDRIADEHPDDDTIIAVAQEALRQTTAFLAEQDLVTLPDEPVEVIVMPEFKRGVSIAYCDAPGPLEQSRETFYAIAPPPASWPAERRTSFYREYNNTMLQELTIHEAMPGHFLQLAHDARFDSPVRSVFRSGTFVEGWALYTEWLMAERGYGGPELHLQRHKMVLRLCLNAIIDHGVHSGTLTHDEAVALMTERGFQEEGEAEGKWKRACLTSTQLSTYLVGLLEVMQIRRDAEARAGASFDEKSFNDELLAHGSPPPRHLRTLLGLDADQ